MPSIKSTSAVWGLRKSGKRKLLLACLRALCAVLGTSLETAVHALSVEGSADDVITHTRQILDTSAADQNDAVIDPSSIQAANIYPNPTTGVVHIEGAVNEVIVYDLTGRQIQAAKQSGNQPIILDLSDFASGIYTLHLTGSGTTAIKRIVKQ